MPETPLLGGYEPSCYPYSIASEAVSLEDLSPRDKTWSHRRAESDSIASLYLNTVFESLGAKISGCSKRLEFIWGFDQNEQPRLKLESAWFCRVRHCSICQWRKSFVWRAKAFQVLPEVVKAYPNHRFIFLTLTWKNCPVSELRNNLDLANKAWNKLTKRKQFPAVGFIKSVEVTRVYDCYFKNEFLGRHGTTWINKWENKNKAKLERIATLEVHPHFHCLLMVKSSYFQKAYYFSQQKWTDLWQQSMKLDYKPIVDVRAVKVDPNIEGTQQVKMLTAILETLKYSVKPSDLINASDSSDKAEENNREFLIKLTEQLHGTRSIATGGILKEYLKELENEPEDLIHGADEDVTVNDDEQEPICFNWNKLIRKYLLEEID